jgi:hypothetical protein
VFVAIYVLVMDAELSHPPESIPNLLGPILDGTHDMVIDSFGRIWKKLSGNGSSYSV